MKRASSGLKLIPVFLLGAGIFLLAPAIGGSAENSRLDELLRAAGLGYSKKWWSELAPDFVYPDVRTGAKLSLRKDFAGKVVLINFWASWCPPCWREMPSIEALYNQFKDEGLVVLGVNVRELRGGEVSKKFAEQWGLTFPIVEGDFWGPPFYDVRPIPQTYLVDRRGRLIGKRVGPLDWIDPSVKALIKFLLAE